MADDCLFFDPPQAYAFAKLRQRVPLTMAVTGLQVCYLVGDSSGLPEVPENLIVLPRDAAQIVDFLARTRLRLPTDLMFPDALPSDERAALGQQVNALIEAVRGRRRELVFEVLSRYLHRQARPRAQDEPLRVMAWTGRTTTVMQWSARALLDAFAELGLEVELVTESNEMESLDSHHLMLAAESFDPHLMININHPNNKCLPPDVVNVVWWQDTPIQLGYPSTLPWRPNDLVYTVVDYFSPALMATGLTRDRIAVQPFCIDTARFSSRPAVHRQTKVVFVGTGSPLLGQEISENTRLRTPEAELVLVLRARLGAGESLSLAEVAALGEKFGLSTFRSVDELLYFVVRDLSVRWLCQAAQSAKIPVEIYGRAWELDPVVAPFCRGEISHGDAVVEIYRSAKYALVPHAFSINSQRLAEVGACGCIPIIYDCRHDADPPFWPETALYFHTQAELENCLRAERPTFPDRFSAFFDYRNFARRILSDAAAFFR